MGDYQEYTMDQITALQTYIISYISSFLSSSLFLSLFSVTRSSSLSDVI